MTSIWMCFLILVAVGITSHLSKAQNLTWNNVNMQNCSKDQQNLSTPRITGHPPEYVRGETFTLTCSVSYEQYSAVTISWDLPTPDNRSITINQNDYNGPMEHNMLSSSLTVTNASEAHAGLYVCKVVNSCLTKTASYKMILLPEPQLNLTRSHKRAEILEYSIPGISFYLIVDSRPNIINYTIYKDQVPIKLLPNPEHYTDEYRNNSRKLIFSINGAIVEDTSNYTISVSNGFLTKSETYDIRKKSIPTVDFGQSNKTCVEGMKTTFKCEVLGYPLPTVTWLYNNTPIIKSSNKIHIDIKSLYKETASLEVERCVDGTITCKAENSRGTVEETKTMQVYEVINGFGIITKMQNEPKFDWFIQNEDVKVKCLASIYKFKNVTWSLNGNDSSQTVNYSYTRHSLVAELNIRSISINGGGRFFCRGLQNNGIYATDHIDVKVSARKAPSVTLKHSDEALLYKLQTVYISCIAVGVPLPKIEWYKDNEKIESIANDTEVKEDPVDYQTLNSTVLIHNVKETNTGTYTCTARGEDTDDSQHYYLVLNEQKSEQKMKYYIIGICVIVFIFSIMVACLIWRDKKRKRRYKEELRKAGLAYFIEGATKSLNPELCIDEQADLLPYDKKFEFPAEKLIFGKKLGAGAFGVVYKAEARGIINAEETTTVAVKMVEKTADNMYIKALASELKIMIHLGKHINIVNLLGACTKNVMKRELLVIVEYCMHGNIHNYIQKHKEVFIDQFSDTNKENNLGTVNIAFSQSGSTGVHSEYFGSTNTQDTLLNTANTNNLRKTSEGYVQPDWRSNYESDYSYNGRTKRPLTSRDLLCWGFQIARGMEYLSKRRIHHGDLAARNVLLAEDNVVKICDFGLARSLYKNDEYRKKENSKSLLPVKWLAIECMTEGLYTTQSDVWSFGVVLWEMFSLAKTPYPNISARDILRYLLEGKRLDKPPYSDERIYEVMKKCWERKPTARPSFTELQETLGTFLEDNVRNHYMELGAAYMEGNSARLEDYLEMVCPPDYNNLVTPSPHHYVNNQSFFAITPKLDEDGYLASPSGKDRALNPKMTTKFSFDARNFNTRPSVASSEGTERTPMLDLNNIHGSGSDSDQEGPTFADHTDTACPTIDEETDDVFETRQAKNAQNIAVTNPTYITFDVDAEKKLPLNTYVNMEPNGLVK